MHTADPCFTFGNLVGPALPAVDGKVTRIRPAQPALQRITVWPGRDAYLDHVGFKATQKSALELRPPQTGRRRR